MSWLLVVCFFILILGLMMLISGNSDIAGSGFCILSLDVFVGFFLLGVSVPINYTYKPVPFTYMKVDNKVVVYANGITKTFEDAKSYNLLDKKKIIYAKIGWNSYGYNADNTTLVLEKGD